MPVSTKKYVVWERNDGLISATAGRLPSDYTNGDGVKTEFKLLLETDNWSEAHALIERERSERGQTDGRS